jgi:hypothetical protein
MKALVIKYHGPTNTKGSRLSVQSQGYKPSFVSLDYDMDEDAAVYILAKTYFENRFRIEDPKFSVGMLPNGTYAAVLT